MLVITSALQMLSTSITIKTMEILSRWMIVKIFNFNQNDNCIMFDNHRQIDNYKYFHNQKEGQVIKQIQNLKQIDSVKLINKDKHDDKDNDIDDLKHLYSILCFGNYKHVDIVAQFYLLVNLIFWEILSRLLMLSRCVIVYEIRALRSHIKHSCLMITRIFITKSK